MPRMNKPNDIAANQLAKLLIIGEGKIGKTHYAGMAAAAGLNVLYLDGDVGSQTLATLPNKARENLYLMRVADTALGDAPRPRFAEIMIQLGSSVQYPWNDTQGRKFKADDSDDDEIWQLRLAKMDQNCLLVIDSWTSLSESIMQQAANAHGVNLADASTSELRPVYQSAGMKGTQILKMIRSAPCHVICIAHPDEYAHQTKPSGKKVRDIRENDMTVDWTKMIPKSTSKPHGLLLPKYFTDVAWAQTNRAGTEFQLNFKLKDDRVSGGHFKEIKSQEEYSFANLIREIGGQLPKENQPIDNWLTIVESGDPVVVPQKKPLSGAGKPDVKAKSMTNLLGKK